MTRPRDRRLPSTLTDEKVRLLTRPTELPPQPWRYIITPNLVDSLIRIANAAGQMTAAPLSYFRRKELEARAKRMRIIWVFGGSFRSAKPEEVEAVLGGARLVEKRTPIAEAIRRAAIVKDALRHASEATTASRRSWRWHTSAPASPCSGPGCTGLTDRRIALRIHNSSSAHRPVDRAIHLDIETDDVEAEVA